MRGSERARERVCVCETDRARSLSSYRARSQPPPRVYDPLFRERSEIRERRRERASKREREGGREREIERGVLVVSHHHACMPHSSERGQRPEREAESKRESE